MGYGRLYAQKNHSPQGIAGFFALPPAILADISEGLSEGVRAWSFNGSSLNEFKFPMRFFTLILLFDWQKFDVFSPYRDDVLLVFYMPF